MKKEKQDKKVLPRLVLSRETIQQLDAPALRGAAGGLSDPHCPPTQGCTTF